MIKINIENIDFTNVINSHIKYVNNTILGRVTKLLSSGFIKKTKLRDIDKIFIKELFGEDKKEIKLNLEYYCTSSDLKEIINKLKRTYKKVYRRNFLEDIEVSQKLRSITAKKAILILNNVLNYEYFYRESNGWSRHKFIDSLHIKVCPYCNRNYITSYEESNDNYKTTADADHYYPKSKYPILQLNIYNMIPSCNICNSKMKNDKDSEHLYPYEDNNDSLSFSVSFDEIQELYNYSEKDIEIRVTAKNGMQKAKSSIETFKLDKVYKIHNDIVFELKNKIRDSIAFKDKDYIRKLLGYDIFDNEEMTSYWFEFLDKDPLNEPLVKLKQDIYYQIKNSM